MTKPARDWERDWELCQITVPGQPVFAVHLCPGPAERKEQSGPGTGKLEGEWLK